MVARVENAIQTAEELAHNICHNIRSRSGIASLIESRDRAIRLEMLDRAEAWFSGDSRNNKESWAALRRELTSEGRGEVVQSPTIDKPLDGTNDHRFTDAGLAEYAKATSKAAKVEVLRDIMAAAEEKFGKVSSFREETVFGQVLVKHGIEAGELITEPAKVKYTAASITTDSYDFAASGVMHRIITSDGRWAFNANTWGWMENRGDGIGSYHQEKAVDAIATALRAAGNYPKG